MLSVRCWVLVSSLFELGETGRIGTFFLLAPDLIAVCGESTLLSNITFTLLAS